MAADCDVHFHTPTWSERHAPALLTAIAAIAIVAMALALRLYQLGERTFHDDESLYSLVALGIARDFTFEHIPELHGPLPYLATAGIFRIFGDSDTTARLAPALAGVLLASLPLAFMRHLGRPGALAASLLLAISPTMLYYSRFAAPDIYLAFFTLATAMVLWRYLAAPRREWLYLMALTLAGMVITSEIALLIVPVFLAYLAYRVATDFRIEATAAAEERARPERTHYDVLGVNRSATTTQIRTAYRTRLDAGQTPQAREDLADALRVLTSSKRAAYDRKIARAAIERAHTHGADQSPPAIASVTAPLLALVWPFAAPVRRRLALKGLPESASALVVMTLLMLPFYGPLVQKLAFIGDRGFAGQRETIVIGGTNTTPGGETPVMLATLGIIFAITLVLGMAWRWHAWLICFAAFYGVTLTAFTGGFTDQGGVWTGLWGTLDHTWRPETAHADGPEFYYGMVMPVYEFLPLAACAAGVLVMLLRGEMRDRAIVITTSLALAAIAAVPATFLDGARLPLAAALACAAVLTLRMPSLTKFLAFWTVASFFAFSLLGRKDPWLAVHVTLPAIMLAAKLLNDAIAAFEVPRLNVPEFRVYAPSRITQGALAATFAGIAVFTLHTSVLAGWGHGDVPQLANTLTLEDNGDTPIELLASRQAAPDVRELSRAIAQAAAASGQGDDITIVLDSSRGFADGWGWYLRDYANLTFADMRKPYDAPAGAIVLADVRNRTNVHADATALTLTFNRRWDFPVDYSAYGRDDIASQLVSANAWSRWFDYATDRTTVGMIHPVEGVAWFPQELSAAITLPRQSDVLSTTHEPEPPPSE